MSVAVPMRSRSTLLVVVALWVVFYGSFTLFTPALLDDADSVHAEVAREMLLRHDYVTLYANGIRYLEKAPLLYWSMAASMRVAMAFGAESARALAAAARVPLALTMLALALMVEAFARRVFGSARAGMYAALIVLSSFGFFLFTRITIPDAMVCLWITCALYCFWRAEEIGTTDERTLRLMCGGFAASCALNVLTKGLIGVVFPVGITLAYLLVTRGVAGTRRRLREMHPVATVEAFLLIAAPWHVLAGLANPTQGHPAAFHFMGGHWQVPMPTDGNVRGWFWFYFMNEHVLRYLNLRVPHDYDTAPLWLFWGLCFVWMMPWSAFVFHAVGGAVRRHLLAWRLTMRLPRSERKMIAKFSSLYRRTGLEGKDTLLLIWLALPLLFFSLSTRQEYYVLPALPAFAIFLAGWLANRRHTTWTPVTSEAKKFRLAAMRCTAALVILGGVFAVATAYFLWHAKAPAASTDLASLLQQNPGDYALSMGHFLDLNAQALGLFRLPLLIAAISLFLGPLASLLLRYRYKPHTTTLALAAGAFGFLLAAHMGLRTFSPVLTSAQLAEAIRSQVGPDDLIAIHGEYEAGSTLGFYLKRDDIHILEGRSSNLWYGSFFPDAPPIFETQESFAAKWRSGQRVFLWQSVTDEPRQMPVVGAPVYVIVKNGGKEIVSNQPNR